MSTLDTAENESERICCESDDVTFGEHLKFLYHLAAYLRYEVMFPLFAKFFHSKVKIVSSKMCDVCSHFLTVTTQYRSRQ